jgi:hypothetical protein
MLRIRAPPSCRRGWLTSRTFSRAQHRRNPATIHVYIIAYNCNYNVCDAQVRLMTHHGAPRCPRCGCLGGGSDAAGMQGCSGFRPLPSHPQQAVRRGALGDLRRVPHRTCCGGPPQMQRRAGAGVCPPLAQQMGRCVRSASTRAVLCRPSRPCRPRHLLRPPPAVQPSTAGHPWENHNQLQTGSITSDHLPITPQSAALCSRQAGPRSSWCLYVIHPTPGVVHAAVGCNEPLASPGGAPHHLDIPGSISGIQICPCNVISFQIFAEAGGSGGPGRRPTAAAAAAAATSHAGEGGWGWEGGGGGRRPQRQA